MLLSAADIRKAIDDGDLDIEKFSGHLEPASYDMRVGAFAITRQGVVDLTKAHSVRVPRGENAIIYPEESLRLGNRIAGRFGLTSRYARRGLIVLGGPQIDPGYEGTLEVLVFNAGLSDVQFTRGEPFATIEFVELKTPAPGKYSGPYQGLKPLSSDAVQHITNAKQSFAEYEEDIRSLNQSYSIAKWVALALLTGLVSGVIRSWVSNSSGTTERTPQCSCELTSAASVPPIQAHSPNEIDVAENLLCGPSPR